MRLFLMLFLFGCSAAAEQLKTNPPVTGTVNEVSHAPVHVVKQVTASAGGLASVGLKHESTITSVPGVPTSSGTPILFVHGFCSSANDWAVLERHVINNLTDQSAASPYTDLKNYTLYYDGNAVQWLNGDGSPNSIGSAARFFSIDFYAPGGTFAPGPDGPTLDAVAVAGISIFNKADELAHVIQAITEITHASNVIVVGHSMGGLVARAYLEGLATPNLCDDPNDYQSCALGTTPYGNEIAKLITLDTPHGGAVTANVLQVLNTLLPISDPILNLFGQCFLDDTLNRAELEETSLAISLLQQQTMQLATSPDMAAIVSYETPGFFSDFDDGVVTKAEQSIVRATSTPSGASYYDVPNEFNSPPANCKSPRILHVLSCLGAQPQTWNLLAAEIQQFTKPTATAPAGIPAGFTVSTAAGNGKCDIPSSGDGGPATKAIICPYGVAVDGTGNIFVSDYDRVRKVSPIGIITTFAGGGRGCKEQTNTLGDGCPATSAVLSVYVLAVDTAGNLYISEGSRIRKVAPNGIITTVAGSVNGRAGYGGDNGPATSAFLDGIGAMAVDSAGNLYVADSRNNRIRKVSQSGVITTFAGTGFDNFSGDGGPAQRAALSAPDGVAVDGGGNVYIADSGNWRIRRVSPDGIITSIAGGRSRGFFGDGGPATDALFSYPSGVAVGPSGSVYITDDWNNRVRRILPNGIISTIAGSGPTGINAGGYGGDGGAATSALLNGPFTVAIDPNENVHFVEQGNNVVRLLRPNGQTLAITNPQPTITNLSPSSVQAGSSSSTVTINGRNFMPISTVTFNGVQRPATFVSDVRLTILLSASDIAQPGSFPIVVNNPNSGGGSSNTVNFTVVGAGSTFGLQGKLFAINGTFTLAGKSTSLEVQGSCDSTGSCSVTVDNQASIASSPIQFQFSLNAKAAISGNTVSFGGPVTVGVFTDSSQGIVATISSVTLSINFTSFATGSSLTGTLTMVTSKGTQQGTFSGTLTAIG